MTWLADRFEYEVTARAVACATCGQVAGLPCVSVLSGTARRGLVLKAVHETRDVAALLQLEAAHSELDARDA